MSAGHRHQAALLVRLREVRMRSAAAALATARAETARAEAARAGADAAAAEAEVAYRAACDRLADDPGEAERLLAVADHRRFGQSVARTTLAEAEASERACLETEAGRRKAMILARARHDILADRAAAARRAAGRQRDEQAASDADEARRQR